MNELDATVVEVLSVELNDMTQGWVVKTIINCWGCLSEHTIVVGDGNEALKIKPGHKVIV